MILESLILGSVALNALTTLAPDLLPSLLGFAERIMDSRNFSIKVVTLADEVTVVNLAAPSELEAGKVPTVNVTVRHNRAMYEWIFARVRDLDTGAIVCPMKRQYVQAVKDFNFTFQGLGPAGDWSAVMPNRDWNLQLEVGLWWL